MLRAGLFGSLILFLLAVPVSGAVLIVDDYNTGSEVNRFGGNEGTWQNNGALVSKKLVGDTEAFGNSGYSLQVACSVVPLQSDGGVFLELKGRDVSANSFLCFRVKGKFGGEHILVGVKDRSSPANEIKVLIDDYLENGVSTSWQKVIIPLSAFYGVQKTSLDNISFSMANTHSAGGTFYIDDILFRDTSSRLWVDTFQSGVDNYNSVGSSFGFWPRSTFGSYTIYNADLNYVYGGAGYSLRLDYKNPAVPGTNLGFWTSLNNNNVSTADEVIFYYKAPDGKVGFQIGIKNSDIPVNKERKIAVTNVKTNIWTKVEIPLASFDLTNYNSMNNLSFTFTSTNTNFLYIDNIYFDDKNAPTAPALLTANGNLVSSGFSFIGQTFLSVTADGWPLDHTMEGVRFEYSLDGSIWRCLGVDYDDTDNTYNVAWNTTDLDRAENVSLRAVAFDCAGNETAMSAISGGSVLKVAAIAYPNPYYYDSGKTIKFINVPNQSQIKIFTISGILICTLSQNADLSYTWSGLNGNGNPVPTGIYLYYAEKDKEVYNSGKFAVINNK